MPLNQNQNIEIVNTHQEISEVIGNPPNWLMRSGIGMVALVFTTLLFFAYFIKYPDTIMGSGIMTSSTPPIELVSRSSGYIENMHFADNELVREGDIILYVHNTSNPDEINKITDWLKKYELISRSQDYLELSIPKNLQLGDLQSDYASLSLKFNELKQNLRNKTITSQRVEKLSEEIDKIQDLNESKSREKNIYGKELELTRKRYLRNENLLASGTVSEVDLENSKMELLQKERQYETMENTIIQNDIRIGQLKIEQLTLNNDRSELVKKYILSIDESIAKIRANIEDWSQVYYVKSPIEGKVSFKTDIKENKPIKEGQILGYILPEGSTEKYLSCSLPIANIGKVKEGQKVIVKFDAYPYKEFGLYISRVGEISVIPEESAKGQLIYEVKVPLMDSLITDFGIAIPYQPIMTSQIEIITMDQSILERIFTKIISLLKTKT